MNTFRPLHGLVAAPHTPFEESGEVALDRITAQAGCLVRQGVKGAFVCGTTGEGYALTNDERRRITEAWVKAADGRLSVVAHVGHLSVQEARGLAEHAAACGADAISTFAPSFVKPRDVEGLTVFCEAVASAAPELPFYYYHIPSLTGVHLSMAGFLRCAADRIPNLAGIKFTSHDLFEFQRCLVFDGGRFDVLWGTDEALLGALAVGARGAVGSTYNYAALLYRCLIEAFESGDLDSARAHSRRSVALVELLLEFGVLAAGKTVMRLHGIDCGPPRPPERRLGEREIERLLERAGDLIGDLVPGPVPEAEGGAS